MPVPLPGDARLVTTRLVATRQDVENTTLPLALLSLDAISFLCGRLARCHLELELLDRQSWGKSLGASPRAVENGVAKH